MKFRYLTLAVISGLFLFGCSSFEDKGSLAPNVAVETLVKSDNDLLYKITVDGHDYLVYDGYYSGAMTHHEGCSYRSK